VNTIDNYFKKITAEVESVNARFDVVAANVAEVVAVVAEVKQEFRTQFESFASELAEVKVLLKENEKKMVLLAENEILKHANAALVVEMEHMRAMNVLQLENAALKAHEPRSEPRSEPKQAKAHEPRSEPRSEPKQAKANEPKQAPPEALNATPEVQETAEFKAERKRIHKKLATEKNKMEDYEGEKLIHYWVNTKHVADDNEHMTDEHRAFRAEMIIAARDRKISIEVEDVTEILKLKDRCEEMTQFFININRVTCVFRNPSLFKYYPHDHQKFIANAVQESTEAGVGLQTGTYTLKSKNYSEIERQPKEETFQTRNERLGLKSPDPRARKGFVENKAYRAKQMAEALAEDAEAKRAEEAKKPKEKVKGFYIIKCEGLEYYENRKTEELFLDVNGPPIGRWNYGTSKLDRYTALPIESDANEESESESEAEDPLRPFEHKGTGYFRDDDDEIYDLDKKQIGRYNAGADEIDLYPPDYKHKSTEPDSDDEN